MTSDLVSIVVPCYGQGHLLSEAIESALDQSYPNIQVIVVNDGSDDRTEEVALSYGDRVRYVRKKRGGVCSARNAGIAVADGRYLLFLDADDRLHENSVAWLVECMTDRDDRLALMGFRFFVRDPAIDGSAPLLPSDGARWFAKMFDTDPLFVTRPPDLDPTRLAPLPYFVYTNFGALHSFLTPRSLLLSVGAFDEELSGCADWDLWLRIALAGAELTTIDQAGAFYRRSDESMSANMARMLDDRARLLLKAVRSVSAQPAMLDHLGPHLLQAARRARRRYFALDVKSTGIADLTDAIRSLLRFDQSGLRRLWYGTIEHLLGPQWDRLALATYRRTRPTLFAYYRADID